MDGQFLKWQVGLCTNEFHSSLPQLASVSVDRFGTKYEHFNYMQGSINMNWFLAFGVMVL